MGFKSIVSTKLVIATAATVFSLSAAPQMAHADECIAPSNPGGGWDFTCRTIGRILTELDLVDGNVQITNMPGGVGAVTYAMVEAERSDGRLVRCGWLGPHSPSDGRARSGA